MKGLFSVIGLIAALFLSNAHAISIYDTASYLQPKIENENQYNCLTNLPYISNIITTASQCLPIIQPLLNGRDHSGLSTDYQCQFTGSTSLNVGQTVTIACTYAYPCSEGLCRTNSLKGAGKVTRMPDIDSSTCPPDLNPLYVYGYDENLDGKYDKCFNPAELDNASNCAAAFNSARILTATSSSPATVCKTDDNGSKCAYSRVDQGGTPYFQPNLEIGCFGDDNEIPDYDQPDTQQPQPEQCVPYAQGFACAADPSKYCDASGQNCVDGCGYVNGQFVCFRDEECTGDSCEPAPVNCENTPDAPICKNQPDPDICTTNPNDPSCTNPDPDPEPCTGDNCVPGGGGGSNFVLDYEKLGNLMKDAAKLLIDDNEISDGKDIKDKIAESEDSIQSGMDDFLSNSLFDDIAAAPSENIFAEMSNMLPNGGTCSPITFAHDAVIDVCGVAERLRPLLYFVFAFLTLIYLRNLLSSTIRATGAQ